MFYIFIIPWNSSVLSIYIYVCVCAYAYIGTNKFIVGFDTKMQKAFTVLHTNFNGFQQMSNILLTLIIKNKL